MTSQNVNVARFAGNVEWDFFCDSQTPCFRGSIKLKHHLSEIMFQSFRFHVLVNQRLRKKGVDATLRVLISKLRVTQMPSWPNFFCVSRIVHLVAIWQNATMANVLNDDSDTILGMFLHQMDHHLSGPIASFDFWGSFKKV